MLEQREVAAAEKDRALSRRASDVEAREGALAEREAAVEEKEAKLRAGITDYRCANTLLAHSLLHLLLITASV